MNDVCKWLADEVCVNVDCPYVADFCPSTEHPKCCVHFQESEETTVNDRERKADED